MENEALLLFFDLLALTDIWKKPHLVWKTMRNSRRIAHAWYPRLLVWTIDAIVVSDVVDERSRRGLEGGDRRDLMTTY